MRIFYGLALILLARDALAQGWVYPDENVCTTPDRVRGTCINIKSCPSMLALLQRQPLSSNDRAFLQQSQCGFEGRDPKVCCPSNNGVQAPPTTTQRPQTNANGIPDVTRHPNLRLLDLKQCGPMNDDRIVGGTEAKLGEFPWMALLAYDVGSGKTEFRCGGSVINNRYILTAAHCVTGLPSNLRLTGVRVGEHDITTEQDCRPTESGRQECNERYQDFGIESVIFHPEYSRTKLRNDIAVIRVNRQIDFRPKNAKPICMPIGPNAEIPTKQLVVSGWGVYEARVSSPVLLKVKLPIFDQEQCKTTYQRQTEIWHKQLCMGGKQGRDSCSGDSGGPLQVPVGNYFGNVRYVQYGLVSFGVKNCGTEGFPGVYTRVAYYLDWVLDNMRD